jgi:DNA-binding PucR family transcriptional regulator
VERAARPMNNPLRSRVSLSRILSVLGPSLLETRWLPPGDAGDVMDIVIWDAVDEPSVAPGDLVLGVGVRDAEDHSSLLGRLAGTRCAGLVVKGTGGRLEPLDGSVVAAAQSAGVPLVQLTNGASWEQIVVLIRSLIVSGTPSPDGRAAGTMTDLFTLAEVVSAVLGAPVTIEDRSSRVLAFSEDQSGVDEARAETILGRQVPERFIQELSDRGIFRRLSQDAQPVFMDALYDGMKPRTAVSVRAGQEVLGSIWVATDDRLSVEREQWLIDAARLVALHLLRLRSETDVRQRTWSDHLSTLLQGGQAALEMAGRLGLGAGPPCVIAATTRRTESVLAEAELQRLETSLSVHLKAVRPRSAVARVHDVVYAVLSPIEESDEAGRGPTALMQDFVDYTDPSHAYLVGVGRPTRSFADIARSRLDADKTLRVLRNDARDRQVARFVDVQVESLLLRLVDLVVEDEDMALGPLAALAAYDQRHHANLLETLVAFLDSFGDVSLAAKSVHVHTNTFRYRLRRLSAISGIDLESPETRFGAMLRLRLWELGQRGDARIAFAPRPPP